MSTLDYILAGTVLTTIAAVVCGRMAMRGTPWWVWGLLVLVGVGFPATGWYKSWRTEQSERLRLKQEVWGELAVHAAELERLGHAALASKPSPKDPRYKRLTEAQERWLGMHPQVRSLSTLRVDGQRNVRYLLASGKDPAGNAAAAGEAGARVSPGGLNREVGTALVAAFRGEEGLVDDPKHAPRGERVTVYHPLKDATGKTEAVLVAEVDAPDWSATVAQTRTVALFKAGLTGAGVLILILSGVLVHLIGRNAGHRRRNAELARRSDRFETLVNSLDSIVFECDASDLRFTYVSKQAKRILGYEPDGWLESPDFRKVIVHGDDHWALGHCRNMVQSKKPYEFDYRVIAKGGRTLWVRESGRILSDDTGAPSLVRGVIQDVTEWKEIQEEMERVNRSLLESSRHAGMAEVATSVLHDVGNLLNSISVSATLAVNRVRGSKAGSLRQAALLMRGHNGHLAEFLTEDPKGRLIPEYLDTVTEQLSGEQLEIIDELSGLSENIEQVKEVVAKQQSLAEVSDVSELLHPGDLADEALRMKANELRHCRVGYRREYSLMPPQVRVDRHKSLQILICLIQNAMEAMEEMKTEPACGRLLVVRVAPTADGDMVAIRVCDNGVGIAREDLTKIFRHGFTTKNHGPGFSLHSAANFAKEMGGTLTAESAGPGHGAEFILTLPTR